MTYGRSLLTDVTVLESKMLRLLHRHGLSEETVRTKFARLLREVDDERYTCELKL